MKPALSLIALIALILNSSASFSKTDDIRGTITDKQNKSVEFANVVLLNPVDSSLVKAAMTDESGRYVFEGVEAGNYLIMVAQMGFEKYSAPVTIQSGNMEIPTIKLDAGAVNLHETHITAYRPLIEHHIDKTVVNVENSIVNTGSTLLEILKRSPGVTADNEGNVSLRGKSGVLIMIDGKPSYLSPGDLANLLKTLRSDDLSHIEIITNPSAKYDAEGNSGIINIRLRKKQNLGFNGSVHTSYGQGVYPDFGTGVNLNYRVEKFNAFGSYNFWRGYFFEKTHLTRKFREDETVSLFDQHSFDKAVSDNHNIRGGFDYYFNDKHVSGILIRSSSSTNDDKATSTTKVSNSGNIDSAYTTSNNSNSKYSNYSINLNHVFRIDTAGRELKADLDYAEYDSHADFLFRTDHYSPDPLYIPYTEVEKSNQPATISIRAAKADYTHPLKKSMKIETGIKSSFVSTDNDVKYYKTIDNNDVLDSGKTNHFKYEENINAAYINWSAQVGKFGLQAGLRGEQTISKGDQMTTSADFERNYFQLFPSAFIRYKISDKHQVGLNYSRRIDRPAYQQLNPFRYFLDPYTFFEGNPNLEPQLTHSSEVSYTYNNSITVAVNYRHTDDAMTQISKQIDSTRTTFATTENLESHDNYGVSLSIPYDIAEWWMTSTNFNLYNNNYTGMVSGGLISKRMTSFHLNCNNSFRLKNGWAFELEGFYQSKRLFGTFLFDPNWAIGGGISKTFFDRRLQVRVQINDIFHTEVSHSVVKYNNVDTEFDQTYDTQFARFHVSYNFGKQTVEQARRRRGGAEDEQNRVRQGRN